MSPSSTALVVEAIRDARAAGRALRIVGGGRWLDAGAPCDAESRLELGGLAGIVEYEPGDLTLTARAGTTLESIDRATEAHGQWLPLDPMGPRSGTLGATLATASYGPLAAAFGTPRNQVLGCELVTGAGDVVRAGGRVVKNVAGFDITRLMIGAWGTLGALTEVTLRVRARPEADATVAIALGGAASLEHACRWLQTSEYAPLAAELLTPALAGRLGIPASNAPVLLLRIGGNAAYLRGALHAVAMLGDVAPVPNEVWAALATSESSADASLRVSAKPARFTTLWPAAREVVERAGGVAHANVRRGVVRCIMPIDVPGPVGLFAALPSCTLITERGPAWWWATRGLGEPAIALSAGVQRAFDPDEILNPGIMGAFRTVAA